MTSEGNPLKHEQKFRYYSDEECRVPLAMIKFPTPVVRGLETAKLEVYAKNVTPEELVDIEWIPSDPDLKIEWDSNKVEPYGKVRLVIKFTPKEDRKTELDSDFTVRGRAIIRGTKVKQ